MQRIFFCLVLIGLVACNSKEEFMPKIEVKENVTYVYNKDKGIWAYKQVSFEKKLQINENEDNESLIGRPIDIATDNAGNIYVTDLINNDIKVFGSDGAFKRNISRKGNGPEELSSPTKTNVFNDMVYILNKNKISIFDTSGKFKDYYDLTKVQVKDFIFNPNSNEFLFTKYFNQYHKFEDADKYTVFTLSKSGEIISTFGNTEVMASKKEADVYASNSIAMFEDKIITLAEYPYVIKIYNDKKLERVIYKDNYTANTEDYKIHLIDVNNGQLEKVYFRFQYPKILTFPDGNILVIVMDKGIDFYEDILKKKATYKVYYDLYNSEGVFLKRFSWPFSKREFITHIDKEGYVYTLSDFDRLPEINKYKISFN